jgi:predicted amidophosphoribosyltransferase
MKCRQCGTEIADKALICFRCGTAVVEAVHKPAELAKAKRPTMAYVAVGAIVLMAVALLLVQFW